MPLFNLCAGRILRVSPVASTMDFASLTRPAVICHCRRCFSSLAVLENEWAEVSNFYATSTAWVSVDADRISISTQRKRIPEHSDASLIRGRITQEASCRMCPTSSKLGVLVEMDNGPIFIWKMSKVAFREVVSMRPTEPVFKDGAIDKLLTPPTRETPFSARSSIQGGVMIPAGATDFRSLDPVMQHHMQHQGRSIDQISTSVNTLQDTMSDLKNSFNSLRIELNVPTRHGELGSGAGFDMVATVLKELKSKSDEIEKLKLEIEALKLKARIAEDSKPHTPEYMAGLEGALPRMQSPDLLQAGRKRGWADTFSGGNQLAVTDTFDEDDMEDDLSITGQHPLNGTQIPMRELAESHSERQWYDEVGSRNRSSNRESGPSHPQQSPAKRQRISQNQKSADNISGKRKPGRPRKSDSQTSQLNQPQRSTEPGDDSGLRQSTHGSPSRGASANKGSIRPRGSFVAQPDQTTEQEIDGLNDSLHQHTPKNITNGDTVIPDSSQALTEITNGGQSIGDVSMDNQTAPHALSEAGDGSKSTEGNAIQILSETANGIEPQPDTLMNNQETPQTTTEITNGNNKPAGIQNALQKPTETANDSSLEENGASSRPQNSQTRTGKKKRKASLAARDAMVRQEMQREEAMGN